ncbi:hypothetical protein HOL63_01720 [Candidatus Peregrinibacteria bacterium]|jgi:hypothetical protein|nr:hypothetical protein [Candidatus Peregrinibacteria bacterium]MBT5468671.1 hypothetical protein [Candidatus Peregrinibacteria bacterium]MBT7337831.1 hypothetical protein [Candidatus Peregrinibacteria bacterium]
MKKLSLLIGTLGGATAGYLFSNKTLREKIANAKDGEEAAKLLGSALQKDGKKLAKQVQEFIDSDEVQNNVTKAKKFAEKKVSEAKKELNAGKSQVKKSVATAGKKVEKSAKKAVKKGQTKAKKTVKKTTEKARKTAAKTAKRVKTNVRKLT